MLGYIVAAMLAVMSIGMMVMSIAVALRSGKAQSIRPPMLVWAVAIMGYGAIGAWSTHLTREMRADIRRQSVSIQVRAAALQQRINANAADMGAALKVSSEPRDPNQAKQWQERVRNIAKEASSFVDESKALQHEAEALGSASSAASKSRDWYELLQIMLLAGAALIIAMMAVTDLVIRKRRIAERNSNLRRQGIDPMVPSDQVRNLAKAGRKIQAIAAYRKETGAALVQAKEAIEKYQAHEV
jgi:hypothetical protein